MVISDFKSNINVFLNQFSWRYFLFAIICIAVLTFLEFSGNIHFKEILSKDQNTQYIVVVSYTIILPFLFCSILKMLTTSTHTKKTNADFLSLRKEEDAINSSALSIVSSILEERDK